MHKDGSRIPLLGSLGALRDGAGSITGYVGVYTDMAHYHLLEAQLRQSQKMEAIGRLAGGIAHDFNNMLTVITSYVQMLQAVHVRDDDTADLAEIAAAASRAAGLTRQLLTFSRKQVVQVSTVNLSDVVSQIEPMLRRISVENVQFRTSLAPDLGFVRVDAAQMEQVVMNLSVNAVDAMPHGGSLLFETANVELDEDYALSHPEVEPGAYVMLATTDTGVGMNAATLARIFEPFFTTKEVGRGTGQGLALARAVVHDQHGGRISLSSHVGVGTTFTIRIPINGQNNTGVPS
jgi:signal transduction histidine kinase